MSSSLEEAFFNDVRRALRDRGEPVDLPDSAEIARVIEADADLPAVLVERARQAKMSASRVTDEAGMLSALSEILASIDARTAIVPDEGLIPRDAVLGLLGEKGIALIDANNPDAAFLADVGITGVDAAIAETASLCVSSGGGRRRLASLAVPVHVAIVRAEQILPDLFDWATQLPADLPASTVLVSAPSKTADIELQLVMGVHGPKQQHVIVIG